MPVVGKGGLAAAGCLLAWVGYVPGAASKAANGTYPTQAPTWQFSATISPFRKRPASKTMEINPYLNRIKDLTERTESLRGYL